MEHLKKKISGHCVRPSGITTFCWGGSLVVPRRLPSRRQLAHAGKDNVTANSKSSENERKCWHYRTLSKQVSWNENTCHAALERLLVLQQTALGSGLILFCPGVALVIFLGSKEFCKTLVLPLVNRVITKYYKPWTAGILTEAFRAYASKNCATWAIGVFFNHRILTPFRL